MTTVADVTAWLEQFAPSRLAEPWDNVGLLWGDPGASVERVMTCLTVTPASAAEAIREQAGLIVSHHPVLFREVKKIRADLPETDISGSSPARASRSPAPTPRLTTRTAGSTTSSAGGSAWSTSHRYGRYRRADGQPRPRRDRSRSSSSRPRPSASSGLVRRVRRAEPAGSVLTKNARSRSPAKGPFSVPMTGQPDRGRTRAPRDGPRAAAGIRLPGTQARRCAGVDSCHITPTKSPRSTSIRSTNRSQRCTCGRSRPDRALRSRRAASRNSRRSPAGYSGDVSVAMAGDPRRPVQRVAVACGAGDDFLKDAARAGADVLLTGEARFHRATRSRGPGHRPAHGRALRDRTAGRRGACRKDRRRVPRACSLAQPRRAGPGPAGRCRLDMNPHVLAAVRTDGLNAALISSWTSTTFPIISGIVDLFLFFDDFFSRLVDRVRFTRLTRARLAPARCRDRQVHLMLPLTRPELTRPALQRDGANRRAIFVANHFTPCTRVRCTHLRGALTHAQQPLARRCQARHRPPILCTTRSTAHRMSSPTRLAHTLTAESPLSACQKWLRRDLVPLT